jgi:endonuclease YncB( thermonuclease family)
LRLWKDYKPEEKKQQ